MSGLLKVIGPFTMPSANNQPARSAYVVLGATGARTFIDINGIAYTTWIASLNQGVGGGSTADGADMLLFTAPPYVDNAGITFAMAGAPQWPTSGVDSSLQLYQYVNLWFQQLSSGWNGPTEAVLDPTPYNYVSFSFQPYVPGSSSLVTCPQGPNLNMANLQFGNSGYSYSSSSSSSSNSLSGGQIAGIVIGTVAAFIIAILLTMFLTILFCAPGGRKSVTSRTSASSEVSKIETGPETAGP